MSRSGSGKPDPVLEGVEWLFHQKDGSASFGAKMALLSLNVVDPDCMNSITVSTCKAKCSNILHDTYYFYMLFICQFKFHICIVKRLNWIKP